MTMTEKSEVNPQEAVMMAVRSALVSIDAGEELEVDEAIVLVMAMATGFAGTPPCACSACRKAAGAAVAAVAKAIDRRAGEDERTLTVPWTPLVHVTDDDGKTATMVFCG